MANSTNDTLIFEANVYSTVIREILNSACSGNIMSSLLMSVCTVDYMGVGLALPDKNTNVHFKQFLEKYMSKANSKYLAPKMQDIIYAIRCSLVHVFGDSDATKNQNIIPEFFIDRCTNDDHLINAQNGNYEERFRLSIPHFIGEVIAGVHEYFKMEKSNLSGIVSEWGKQLYWSSGAGILGLAACFQCNNLIYKNIHPILTVLGDPNKKAEDIAEYIADKILTENNY